MIWLVILLGFILRLIHLDQSLWLDEATQVILSQDSLKIIFLSHGADFHPPLSYVLMHFWIIFGTSEIWLRLLSVIFGILTIWVIYKFSTDVFNKKVGILSALFLSIAPYHIYYSQEARMYSEATFFAALSMYYFYKSIQKGKFIDSLVYVLSSVALIYTHYDGFFLIFSQLVYILIFKRNLMIRFLKRVIFIIIIWLPWLPQFLLQLKNGSNIDEYLPGWRDLLSVSFLKVLPLTLFKFSFGRIDFDSLTLYIFAAVIVLSIFGYILYRGVKSANNEILKIFTFWLFIPIILAILISFKLPIDQPFRVLYTLPAFYTLLALGILSLTKFKKAFLFSIIGISIFGLALYYFNPKYWREDWREASNFVLEKSSADTIVLFAWPDPFPPYQYYAGSKFAKGVVKKFPATLNEVKQTLSKVDSKKEIYLFEYLQKLSDPNKFIQLTLKNNGYYHDQVYDFRGVGFVYHFVKGT